MLQQVRWFATWWVISYNELIDDVIVYFCQAYFIVLQLMQIWFYILSFEVFFILGLIIGIHGSVTTLLSVFSVSGGWRLFSLIIEYKWFRSCPFSTNISTRKFNSSLRHFVEHNFIALDANPLKMPLINAGLTYECGYIWILIAFFRCILNSYFLVLVSSKDCHGRFNLTATKSACKIVQHKRT